MKGELEKYDDQFNLSITLLKCGSFERAKELFLECVSYNNEYWDKLFKLINDDIFKKNYSDLYFYFDLVIASGEDRYIRDVKFYLYLMNYLFDIPIKYMEIIKKLEYEDIKVDESYPAADEINKVRQCALSGKYYQLDGRLSCKDHFRINYQLWFMFSDKVSKFLTKVSRARRKKNYEELVRLISLEGCRRNLSKGKMRLKKLAEIIVDMKKGIMPKTSTDVVDNEDDAIEIGNFQLAYQLRKNRKKENGTLKPRDNTLGSLKEIIDLLNRQEIIDLLDRQSEQDIEVSFDELFNMLIGGTPSGVKQGLEVLPSYLKSIGKSEYVDLMSELIKICVLEQEKGYEASFLGPLYRLAQLKQFGRIELDILLYESYAMLAFNNGDMDFAKKYIDIILYYIDIVDSEINLSKPDLTALRERLKDMLRNINIYNKGIIPYFRYFKVDIEDYYYGIPSIDSIMRAIENTNLDIRSACRLLEIDSETMNFIILIYAKNSYSCGFYEHGDRCLRVVEKNKNKSQQLILALRDVRVRKRFYANGGSIPRIDLSKVKLLNP